MSSRTPFKDVIGNKQALLFDGATGTELYNRGMFINRCFEDANLNNPSLVKELHADYVKAGAQVISTNSWGANSFKLRGHNLNDKTYEINKRAAEIAREVIEDDGYVAGSVGPLGVRIEPWGPTSFEQAKDGFKEQIKGLVDGGVDVISLETFGDISELQQAIIAAREVASDIPVMAMITINTEGQLPIGTPVEWAIKKINDWGVDALGFNCSVGPQPVMSAVNKILSLVNCPIIVQPNAGLPKQVDGHVQYTCAHPNIWHSSPSTSWRLVFNSSVGAAVLLRSISKACLRRFDTRMPCAFLRQVKVTSSLMLKFPDQTLFVRKAASACP